MEMEEVDPSQAFVHRLGGCVIVILQTGFKMARPKVDPSKVLGGICAIPSLLF